MSLFLKPLRNVNFDDVKGFCDTYSEGVRVEYKRDVAHIPKTVSSFANTAGGIWLIGIVADSKKNQRRIVGVPGKPGYEEQIIQACITGIYPPLRPDVRVCDMPDDPEKVIIMVKVSESVEAPHAIENSTRAYVRTGNVSQPYELSEMDRLEYLFKRRQQAETKREELIARMATRSRMAKALCDLQIVISPTYPREPLKTLEEIEQFVYDYRAKDPMGFLDRMRRVQGGMMSVGLGHLELNEFGVVLNETNIAVGETTARGRSIKYIQMNELISQLYYAISITKRFIGEKLLSVMMRVRLSNCDNIWLARGSHVLDEMTQPGADYTSYEPMATAETRVAIEALFDRVVGTITDLVKQISWHFNRSDLYLEEDVKEFLKRKRQ